ncbi:hypothetical protein F5884DRAFT_512338 [Xylogone sp. PMI_703]|nr:hypothetical protein F5884DRAFT_512338 [Xylogone sp. PMI_703]
MADNVHRTTQNIADSIKGGLHGIHGAGEMLRGGAMETVDKLFGETGGESASRRVTDQGAAEMDVSKQQLGGSHATSHGTGTVTGTSAEQPRNLDLRQGAGVAGVAGRPATHQPATHQPATHQAGVPGYGGSVSDPARPVNLQ